MHRSNCLKASLCLAATIAISAAVVACSPQPNVTVNEPAPRDSHHWDDHENQAWHRFLTEKSRQDHEYTKADKNEQDEYWSWRHSHPD